MVITYMARYEVTTQLGTYTKFMPKLKVIMLSCMNQVLVWSSDHVILASDHVILAIGLVQGAYAASIR